MRRQYTLGNKMRSLAWIVGTVVLLAIVGGIIVDIDHPTAQLLENPDRRFLMPYFAVAGGVLLLAGFSFLLACLCRYTWIRFLKKFYSRRQAVKYPAKALAKGKTIPLQSQRSDSN